MGNSDSTVNTNNLSYDFLFGKTQKNYQFEDFFHFKKEITDIFYRKNQYKVMDIELFRKFFENVVANINPVIATNIESIESIKETYYQIATGKYDWSKLSLFYNEKIMEAQTQQEETCYAHAVSTIIHLANSRVIGRPLFDFEKFCDKLINKYGKNGADLDEVLKNELPNFRLRYEKIDCETAKRIKRPCLVGFDLDKYGWEKFSRFFREEPKGILNKNKFNSIQCKGDDIDGGHAVVLLNYNDNDKYIFLNSWGKEFGDEGKFRLDSFSIFDDYDIYDIFWYEKDLSKYERSFLQEKGKLGSYIHYALEAINKTRELGIEFLSMM